MKNIQKALIATVIGLGAMGVGFLAAYASPGDWRIILRNTDDTADVTQGVPTFTTSTPRLLGGRINDDSSSWYTLKSPLFFEAASGPFGSNNYSIGLDSGAINVIDLTGTQDLLDAKASASSVSTLSSSVSSINTTMALINANLYGTSTLMYASDASTTAGLMSDAETAKLAAMPSYVARSASTSTRLIATSTGAVGFQVSSARDSEVRYSATIVTTATIGGNQSGTFVLEIAPTNSATAGDWAEIGRCTNGQAISLAIALQSVQTTACQMSGYIPSGYYTKIRSINNSGTPSFTFNSGQEVLL